MKVISLHKLHVSKVIDILKKGGLVIMPTETLYGAFADATNAKAIKKLAKFKARPLGKPYSVAVSDQKMAEKYVVLNSSAKKLYKNFLPGPLTVISSGKHLLAPGVESETGTLGIRIPDYKLVLDIVKKFGKPLTATSANASYKKRPYKVSDILENISQKQKKLIDLIIDAGELPHNEPSTVVDTTFDDPSILRQGNIKLNDKNEIISQNSEATQNFAKELWHKYETYLGVRAIVFALEGPMGAGKTVFTKGLAKAVGVNDEITSPTYDLEHTYALSFIKNLQLVHVDAWRLQTTKEFLDIGFLNNIVGKSIVVIEWADRVSEEIRKRNEDAVIIWIKIKYGKRENERKINWNIV